MNFHEWNISIYDDVTLQHNARHVTLLFCHGSSLWWSLFCQISPWIMLCFFLSCVCYAFVSVCLYVPCGHLLGKGWPLGSRLWCPTVFVTFPLVSWVRCGTWLYRFLIFAPLLTSQRGKLYDYIVPRVWYIGVTYKMYFMYCAASNLTICDRSEGSMNN